MSTKYALMNWPTMYALSSWNDEAVYLMRGNEDRLEFMLIAPSDSPLVGEWLLFADYQHVTGNKVSHHRQTLGTMLMATAGVNLLPEAMAQRWIARAEAVRRTNNKDLLDD